ncbi:MAG: hypothetical protein KDA28_10270, partial [Phycisphaerales bacterium]|nr:hypothetical protein [Phycisphaerales bacterium]
MTFIPASLALALPMVSAPLPGLEEERAPQVSIEVQIVQVHPEAAAAARRVVETYRVPAFDPETMHQVSDKWMLLTVTPVVKGSLVELTVEATPSEHRDLRSTLGVEGTWDVPDLIFDEGGRVELHGPTIVERGEISLVIFDDPPVFEVGGERWRLGDPQT